MKKFIYADHAATTPLCEAAFEAMVPFLKENFGNPSSLHSWARAPREAIRQARETIAKCINADENEIFFTGGGTEADNWVIKGSSGPLAISAYEHHAVINAAERVKRKFRKLTYIAPDRNGYVDEGALENLESDRGLVSIMMANNELGTINDIEKLCAVAQDKGYLFHTDAVQAIGHIEVDVKRLRVDLLSASAHKFNGPKGVGFLYVKRGSGLRNLVDGGSQERGSRAGTENVAGIVGMAAALKWNVDNLKRNTQKLVKLADMLIDGLKARMPDIVLPSGEGGKRLPGFVSVSIPGRSAEGLLHILDLKGIAVSAGAACNSKATEVSHVLKAIGYPIELAKNTIRITLGVENNEEDVARIVEAIGW